MKNITLVLQVLALLTGLVAGALGLYNLIVPIMHVITGLAIIQSLSLLVIALLVRIAWKAA
jgi:hypothetical protein